MANKDKDVQRDEQPGEQADDMSDPLVGGTPVKPETEEEYQERMREGNDDAERIRRESQGGETQPPPETPQTQPAQEPPPPGE